MKQHPIRLWISYLAIGAAKSCLPVQNWAYSITSTNGRRRRWPPSRTPIQPGRTQAMPRCYRHRSISACNNPGADIGIWMEMHKVASGFPIWKHLWARMRRRNPPLSFACPLGAAYVPFAATKEEREAKGDPRFSIRERYRDVADYRGRIETAAQELLASGFLLPADAEEIFAVPAERGAAIALHAIVSRSTARQLKTGTLTQSSARAW